MLGLPDVISIALLLDNESEVVILNMAVTSIDH